MHDNNAVKKLFDNIKLDVYNPHLTHIDIGRKMSNLQQIIENAFEKRAEITPKNS